MGVEDLGPRIEIGRHRAPPIESTKVKGSGKTSPADIAHQVLKSNEPGEAAPIKKARHTSLENVKKVPYIDAEVLAEKLKPGDILLTYTPKNVVAVDYVLRGGQKLTKNYTKTATKESHNFVHAALYTGGGRISEAIGNGVVISKLEGERFKLEPGMKHGFLVIRPKNQEMALEAAKIAEELSTQDTPKAAFKYSMSKAFFSTLRSSELDEESVKRYLKGAAYSHNKIVPMDKNGIREFFCSYYVGWACQAGESKEVLAKVNQKLPAGKQIKFPDLPHVTFDQQGKVLEEWARSTAKEHYKLFKEHITLEIDPKWTSPQRFYGFVLEHPELFDQEMLIVAPEEEMEMKDFKPPADQ